MLLRQRLLIVCLVVLLNQFSLTSLVQAGSGRDMLNPHTRIVADVRTARMQQAPILSYLQIDEIAISNGGSQSWQRTLPQQSASVKLILDPPGPFMVGDYPTLMAHLTTQSGMPISNRRIVIFVNGQRKVSGQTDSNGLAAITLKFRFSAGKYHIKALYEGSPALSLPALSVEADMLIQPFKAAIRIIPPIAGIKLKLNQRIYTSDEKGFVNIPIRQSGSYSLEILPVDEGLLSPDIKIKFSRWNDNIFTPSRQVFFPRRHPLEAGFVLEYLVDQVFYDSTGVLVDAARISSMTLKGLGSTYTFDQAGPVWLPANRLSRRIGQQLESQTIVYYFKEILIDGATVINKGQQRFFIQPAALWRINVLVYSIQFSARDAMFHFPIGSGIELTYPDGHTKKCFFDSPDSKIKITSLSRGSYSATVIASSGSAPPTPIHISRDQGVELLVLSVLDMTVMFGVPLIFALTLFFVGRPRIFHVVRHPLVWGELIRQKVREESLPARLFKAVRGLLFAPPSTED